MKIAVDAMGGDHAPQAIVRGAEQAAQQFRDIRVVLYGDKEAILPHLEQPELVDIVHTTEKVASDDDPVRAVRRKKKASMVLAAREVKEGKVDAVISAGNTGALLAAGTLIVGRIKGIDRPALMSTMPSLEGEREAFTFMDLGANADCKPEQLYQFGILGSYYAASIRQIDQPTVALLNNGTEDNKGNMLSKAAFKLLQEDQSLNFVGNVEARDILQAPADVIVTDGFTGNAVLKSIEGTAKSLMNIIKSTIKLGGMTTKLGGLLVKKDLSSIKDTLDYSKYGGAVLFGLKAPVIKTHGSANEEAVYHTIKQARDILRAGVIDQLREAFDPQHENK